MSLRSMASGARRVRAQEGRPSPVGSRGVDVTVKGWTPGLNKVRLTQTFRDGGMPLNDAVRATGELLDGREVRVHLSQFESVAAARAALLEIGIADVQP